MSQSGQVTRLSGLEWQDWANLLLQKRYGPGQYQRIPDKDRGDAGLEGFALCGHAYQAYGCQEPISTEKRYELQRDKITQDVGKFISNQAKIAPLLGTIKISRWCLFVPCFDSKTLVAHAATKTAEVLAAALPYVTADFRVMVSDEDDFASERDTIAQIRPDSIYVQAGAATPQHIQEWTQENDTLVQTLDAKVARLPTLLSVDKRVAFRDQVIKHFLQGQNILAALKKEYPSLYERILSTKSDRENYLATECSLATGSPNVILKEALDSIKKAVMDEVRGISPRTTLALSWEAVADWLIRCPLDFP